MDIPGKVAIITGASAGIGLATAKRFAAEGAKVVLAARSADKLTALAAELHKLGHDALSVATDIRDKNAVNNLIEKAFARYGRIDILINNAGQSAVGSVADINPDHLHSILTLNVFGPLWAIQAVVHKMRVKGGGLIINISSMVTRMHIPGLGAYAASKCALSMLSDTARDELAPDKIRVVTVYPRMTATDFGKNALGDHRLGMQQRGHAPVIDTPEYVAGKILEAAKKEPAEQFME
ncbi:MAG TPA: SDR family oxidoreductase [Chitinivibrionales bacterium]|nr:SDR family oxidoreductase [Chitinivibrionales bacterium]